MWRHLASNFLTFLTVLIFLMGGVILWGQREYDRAGPLDTAICLQLPRGSSLRSVSNDLAEQGAIRNGTIFRLGTSYGGKAAEIKAGSWLIPQGASMSDIADLITRGGASTCGTELVLRVGVADMRMVLRRLNPETRRFEEEASYDPAGDAARPEAVATAIDRPDTRFRLALAEGVTSWQVVQGLKAMPVLKGNVADVPPEGTLAPDSYEVTRDEARADIIKEMTDRQDGILAEAWANRAEGLPLKTPEDALILASIIEKETGVPGERREVASVFVNRLEKGMRLQTDPTVIYGVTGGKGVLGRGLRQSELRKDTPWNTYVIDGLPKTPIANPGRASIEAAVNPAQTDYLYFVADGSGGHAFSATLAGHNRNVAKWRALQQEQQDQPQQ